MEIKYEISNKKYHEDIKGIRFVNCDVSCLGYKKNLTRAIPYIDVNEENLLILDAFLDLKTYDGWNSRNQTTKYAKISEQILFELFGDNKIKEEPKFVLIGEKILLMFKGTSLKDKKIFLEENVENDFYHINFRIERCDWEEQKDIENIFFKLKFNGIDSNVGLRPKPQLQTFYNKKALNHKINRSVISSCEFW